MYNKLIEVLENEPSNFKPIYDENLSIKEKIKIEEILEESGFSRAYFSREFKKITGNSIVDYINFVRCSRTEELISTGDYIISEAAEMCGFSSMSYFSKTYKKFMGRLPSETVKKNW